MDVSYGWETADTPAVQVADEGLQSLAAFQVRRHACTQSLLADCYCDCTLPA